MCSRRGLALAGLSGLWFIGSSFAATRYVNVYNSAPVSPYTNYWSGAATNIQQAIDVAASGDEILVAPGVYRIATRVEIPQNKTLTLRSTESRAAIIDAQRLCAALHVDGINSVVEGFTLRNGTNASYGGGVSLVRAGTVRDCLVTGNQAWGGGGIVLRDSNALVENCTVQSNLATYLGGGIVILNAATGQVKNCIIRGNVASNFGGGVSLQGAGIVSNCWISDNRAVLDDAGGVDLAGGGRLINSVVAGNQAGRDAGGVKNSAGTVAQCTVVSNAAGRDSGGMFTYYLSTSVNCIVYFNTAPTNPDLYPHWESNVIRNCCTPTNVNLDASNFTNAPAFVDFAARNFHLTEGSPCVDAGANVPGVAADYAGNPRPVPGVLGGVARYDVGAFEYQLPVEVCDGIDNDGDAQVDEDCRSSSSYFSVNQSVACTGAGWSRTFAMDLTNFRNLAVQDGYQSYTVTYSLFYNIWTGIYVFDYDAGAFTALTWLTNLDL